MYMEAGGPHHSPHFHAYYQNHAAVISLDPVEIIAGELPRRQRRFVEAWAELHQEELLRIGSVCKTDKRRYRSRRWSENRCRIPFIAFRPFGSLTIIG